MTTWIELGGSTLLHFLWQGAVVWALVAAALRLASTASSRYAIACGGLAVLLVIPVATAWTISPRPAGPSIALPSSLATESRNRTLPGSPGALASVTRAAAAGENRLHPVGGDTRTREAC